MGIPDANIGIQASGDDPLPVKGDGVDLTKMTLESLNTPSFRDAPDLGHGIITTRNDEVAMDL